MWKQCVVLKDSIYVLFLWWQIVGGFIKDRDSFVGKLFEVSNQVQVGGFVGVGWFQYREEFIIFYCNIDVIYCVYVIV